MLKELTVGLRFTLVTMLLLGAGYHALVLGVGRVAFPAQAEGSLIRNADGTVVGSRLIAQRFVGPEYFHPRPSGVDYNAAAAGGTNVGPSNPDHLADVRRRLAERVAADQVRAHDVRIEMVTASGSGLDPDIPAAAAMQQIRRVATNRNIDPGRVRMLVDSHVQGPTLWCLGPARVNVLELNVALDRAFGPPPAATVTDTR